MVRMCARVVSLIWRMIAASVDDFPDPVTPVTSTRPRSYSAIDLTTGGSPSDSTVGTSKGMARSTSAKLPFWRKMLTRKRPTSCTA